MTAIASHLAYGDMWAGAFATLTFPVTVWKGIGLGVCLWLLMQIVVLPLLGWGLIGILVTPTIAVATLVQHLMCGGAYGAAMDRSGMADRPSKHEDPRKATADDIECFEWCLPGAILAAVVWACASAIFSSRAFVLQFRVTRQHWRRHRSPGPLSGCLWD